MSNDLGIDIIKGLQNDVDGDEDDDDDNEKRYGFIQRPSSDNRNRDCATLNHY